MKTNASTTRTKWAVDQAHSEIGFKIRHLMISRVRGSFKIFDASIYTSYKDFSTAEIDLWIDANSLDTGDTKRDEHLKSPDFFDVKKHSQITYTSSTIGQPDADGNRELWGELTILGITKNIKLNVQFGGITVDPWGNEKAGFYVSGTINRTDWGLVWNNLLEAGGMMVGEEVSILCEVELANIGEKDLTMQLEPTEQLKMTK
ncbi:MAG: YceI family protein [Bacteroidetes bacterium]|nr:YceI family protein [Bacteroidota bacterium]